MRRNGPLNRCPRPATGHLRRGGPAGGNRISAMAARSRYGRHPRAAGNPATALAASRRPGENPIRALPGAMPPLHPPVTARSRNARSFRPGHPSPPHIGCTACLVPIERRLCAAFARTPVPPDLFQGAFSAAAPSAPRTAPRLAARGGRAGAWPSEGAVSTAARMAMRVERLHGEKPTKMNKQPTRPGHSASKVRTAHSPTAEG